MCCCLQSIMQWLLCWLMRAVPVWDVVPCKAPVGVTCCAHGLLLVALAVQIMNTIAWVWVLFVAC